MVINWILDRVFPKTCVACGSFTAEDDYAYMCRECFAGAKRNDFRSDEPRAGFAANGLDRLLAAASFENPIVEKAVKAFKYKFVADLAFPLSALMLDYLKEAAAGFDVAADSPVFVSVPLSRRRLNWRGFNQAELLAREISSALNCEFKPDLLKRSHNSVNQADVESKEARLENVKENFSFGGGDIAGRTVVLVDDVCTTGATLNECAKVLKKAGAGRVIGFVLARSN